MVFVASQEPGDLGSAQNTQLLKPQPNDSNMLTRHIATLLGAACCARLAKLCYVATCCSLLGIVGSNLTKKVKFFMQHLLKMDDAVVVWPGSCNNVAPGHAH